MTFRNEEIGRVSHAMQGFAIDGREVPSLEFSAMAKSKDVLWGRGTDERPMVSITLYDAQRKHLGAWWIGPWHGDNSWHEKSKTIRVPPAAREGILRIGLFGAKGEISFDAIQMKANSR